MPTWTPEQIARRLDRGLGSGDGNDYQPWLGIRDVPSRGIRTRQVGRATNRMHVTMSLLERANLLVAQRLPYLVQVKEQFPSALETKPRRLQPGSASNRPATKACPWW